MVEPHRLNKRLMLPIFVIVSLDAAGAAAVLAAAPFYFEGLGATPVVLGVVLGAQALSQFVGAPLLGQLSDRFGRKRILQGCQIGAVAALCTLAAAQVVWLGLIACVLLGLSAANFSASAAYAADHSSPVQRRQAIGLLSAGLGLGGVIGPSVAGWLSDLSLTASILGALTFSLAALALTTFWLKDTGAAGTTGRRRHGTAGPSSFRSLLTSSAVRVLIVVVLFHYFAYGMYSSELAVFLKDTFVWDGHAFGPKEFGYILTADGVINILVQLFLLKWLGRLMSERTLIVAVLGLLATGYLLAGVVTEIWGLALAVLCVSTGVALARPTFMAALSVHVPPDRQGVVMGASQSLVAATDVVTPVLAGLILGARLYEAWIGAVVAIALAAALIARFGLTERRPPRPDPVSLYEAQPPGV
ncbi:MFS transporter [Streptomyces sp. NPDC093085]|uniref:MFS transporter n=1 Tax=Streptomyces sp. NPDC093085 TaxID=3155068 RepID=UPI00341F9BBB